MVESYNVFINSKQRVSGTVTDGNYSLYKSISLKNQANRFYFRMMDCEIPFSFKVINSTNNAITFTYTASAVYTYSFSVPPGNYSITSLLLVLSNAIYALTNVFQNFTYSQNTGFATFAVLNTSNNYSNFQFTVMSSAMMACLGLTSLSMFWGTNLGLIVSGSSTVNVNCNQSNVLYIRSSNITQQQNFESTITKSDISDILAKIQITSLFGTMINWVNNTELELIVSNKTFDNLNFYLTTNLSYDPIDLNGLNWSCSFTITEREPISYLSDTLHSNLITDEEKTLIELEKEQTDLLRQLVEYRNKNK